MTNMQISEWLPNPIGKDSGNEWIEILNDGAATNLSGWSVKNYKESVKALPGVEVGAGERVLFLASDLKLTLRNSDDYLVLINQEGREVDRVEFKGRALEGYSYGRSGGGEFAWLSPTPGERNLESAVPMLADVGYIKNESGLGASDFMILLLGSSILIVGYLLYTVRQDEYLEKLFFKGDE